MFLQYKVENVAEIYPSDQHGNSANILNVFLTEGSHVQYLFIKHFLHSWKALEWKLAC